MGIRIDANRMHSVPKIPKALGFEPKNRMENYKIFEIIFSLISGQPILIWPKIRRFPDFADARLTGPGEAARLLRQ
jgi:hypothetical protein